MIRVEAIDPLADPRWAAIAAQPQASLYHSVAWARVLASTYGFRPHYYVALVEGRPAGGLPLFEVSGPWSGRRAISLPFADVGGPVGEPGAVLPLLETAIGEAGARGWRTVEIRGGVFSTPRLPLAEAEHNDLYLVPLDRPLGDVVRGFSDSVRWGRKRALREGVGAERSETIAGLREFYRLHQLTRRRLGVPVQPWRFFRHLWQELMTSGDGFCVHARHSGRTIASAVFLRHGDRLYYKFSATDPAALALQPNSLVLWEAIEWAHGQGLGAVDLGKTVRENTGLARFKRSWGAVSAPLRYYYFPQVAGLGAAAEDSPRLRAARALWRRLPLPVARVVGGLLYRALA